MTDATAGTLKVKILALGDDGERGAAALERALRGTWSWPRGIDLQRRSAGDDEAAARLILAGWCARGGADVVLTVGRAGHRREDFAPELAAALIERALPGIEERICLGPPRRPEDLLFRGRAGFRGATLIVNLPGRPARAAAVVRMLAPVVGHALEKARGGGAECGRSGAVR